MPKIKTTDTPQQRTTIVQQLRANRQSAGLKPSEIDYAAYYYESEINLRGLSRAALASAQRQHAAAIERARALRAQRHQPSALSPQPSL